MKTVDNHRKIFYISLALTIALMFVHWYSGIFLYEENDDIYITALLKGLFGLEPSPEGIFISPLLSALFYAAYAKFPEFPFFSAFVYAGIASSCLLATYTILKVQNNFALKAPALIGACFFIALMAMGMSFTSCALILWVTACALLFATLRTETHWRFPHTLASGQLAAAYLLRPGLMPILVVFSLPLIMFLFTPSDTRSLTRKIIFPLLVIIVLNLIVGGINRGQNYRKYQDFNRVRSDFTDTARSNYGEKTNAALFSADWSKNDYTVMKNWWLHDGEIFKIKSINNFLNKNSKKTNLFSFEHMSAQIKQHVSILVFLLLWGFFCFTCAEKNKKTLLRMTAFTLLTLAVIVLMGVRFPRRIALPSFFMLFLYAATFWENLPKRQGLQKLLTSTISVFFLTALIVLIVPQLQEAAAFYPRQKKTKNYIDQTVEKIIEVNGKNTVLVDVNPHILPTNYLPFKENDPILQVPILGTGWLIGSPVYIKQLKKLNLGSRSEVVPALIDNPQIILRYWDSNWQPFKTYVYGPFLSHLRENYSSIKNGRRIDIKVLRDFRSHDTGLIYFQLVTAPPSL